MDEATDVAFAAEAGAQPIPERFPPTEVLMDVAQERGFAVEEAILQRGQSLVGPAAAVVGMVGQDPEPFPDALAGCRTGL